MDSLLAVSPLPFLSRRDLHSGRRGRGRRGNIALQCMKQFFPLSLFPTRRPFPDSSSSIRSDLSPGSSGDPGCDSTSLVIYGERRFEFFFFSLPFFSFPRRKRIFIRSCVYLWTDRSRPGRRNMRSRELIRMQEGEEGISSRYMGYFYR